MIKKTTLSLFSLGCLSLGVMSCGGSGSTESSDITPGEHLTFVMGSAHGTINIQAVTPTSGIVYYLGVPIAAGGVVNSINLKSDKAINFYYRPSTKRFDINFRTANNWHIDAGPVVRDLNMDCSFGAIITPSWENGQATSGSMEYSLNRQVLEDDINHPLYALLTVNVTGQTGTYNRNPAGNL